MKDVVNAFDKLPWIVKLILCIPVLNIAWAVYRICKGASSKKTLLLIVGILWIVPGALICWLVDIVCTILFRKPTIFA